MEKFSSLSTDEIYSYLSVFHDDYIYAICELLRRGEPAEKIHETTKVEELFIECFKEIVEMEVKLKQSKDSHTLKEAKILGFSDAVISEI